MFQQYTPESGPIHSPQLDMPILSHLAESIVEENIPESPPRMHHSNQTHIPPHHHHHHHHHQQQQQHNSQHHHGLGPKMSGNGSGSSCHQCKSRRSMNNLIFCSNMFTKRSKDKKRNKEKRHVCRKKYCDQCLQKFYHEKAPSKRQDPSSTWLCPACRGLCCCAACRRQKTKGPGGGDPLTMSPATSLACGLVYFKDMLKFKLSDPANPELQKALKQLNNGEGPFKNGQLCVQNGTTSSGNGGGTKRKQTSWGGGSFSLSLSLSLSLSFVMKIYLFFPPFFDLIWFRFFPMFCIYCCLSLSLSLSPFSSPFLFCYRPPLVCQ